MGHFTQAVEETIVFDGDEVKLTLRRMQNKHMLKFAPEFKTMPGENILARTARLVDASRDILKECITNLRGLKDSDGNAITLDVAMEEAYFLPLFDAVLGRLLAVSVMQEVDAKKSGALPPAVSSGVSANPTLSAAS